MHYMCFRKARRLHSFLIFFARFKFVLIFKYAYATNYFLKR